MGSPIGTQVSLEHAEQEVPVLNDDGVVQAVLFTISLGLGFSGVLSQDRIGWVDGGERHDEEYENGDT